jgi:hypothetical protein
VDAAAAPGVFPVVVAIHGSRARSRPVRVAMSGHVGGTWSFGSACCVDAAAVVVGWHGGLGVSGVFGLRDLRLLSPAATLASLGWSAAWGPDLNKRGGPMVPLGQR